MPTFVVEAGWGIWPVLTFGLCSFVLAVRYAVAPRREHVPLIVGFGVATILAGCLGAVTGVQHSIAYVAEVEASKRWILLLGLRESLHNVVAAFVITALDALLASLGGYRLAKRAPAASAVRIPAS